MIPLVVIFEPNSVIPPRAIIPLVVGITPSARGQNVVILPGSSISGSSAVYSDLHGLSAYAGASGTTTANRGRKGLRRTARGGEDGTQRQG
jgi:hypothetical protein